MSATNVESPAVYGDRRLCFRIRLGLARWSLWLTIALCLGGLYPSATAQTPTVIDPQAAYNLKAVFLYSFGRYIEWPANSFQSPKDAFVIGVLGEDPFGGTLDQIARSKQIQGRPIVVQRFETLDNYKSCHILFMSKTTPTEQQQDTIRRLQDRAVLLVGETPGFIDWGGTVNFYLDQDTVRFELNLSATKQQGLEIDAKLLNLAKIVKK